MFDAAVQQQQHPASIPAAHPPHITLPEGPCSTKPDWEAAFQQLEGICSVPAGIYREKAARREAGSAEPEVSLPLLSAPRSFPESKMKNVCLPCQYFSLAPLMDHLITLVANKHEISLANVGCSQHNKTLRVPGRI